MNWLRWRQGRTAPNNYFKMMLFTLPNWFDVYLLRFPTGSSINWHTDPVHRDGFSHYRLNIFLRKAKKGGQVMTKLKVETGENGMRVVGKLTLRHKLRWHYMRPDVTEHAFSKVEEGSCLVLSIGWICGTTDFPGHQ